MNVFYAHVCVLPNFCMGMTPVPPHTILSCTNIPLSEPGGRRWNRLQVLFQRTPYATIDLKKTACLHKNVDFPLPNIFLQFSHILSSIASIEMLTQQDFSGRDWFPYWLLYHGEITVFSNVSCICIQNTEIQLHKDRSLHRSLLQGHSETNACTLVFTHLCGRQSFRQMSLYHVDSCHSTWPDSCRFASFLRALTFLLPRLQCESLAFTCFLHTLTRSHSHGCMNSWVEGWPAPETELLSVLVAFLNNKILKVGIC